MKPCDCTERHARRRVVLTGGPGAGKTAVLELIRLFFCEHVKTLPESASIIAAPKNDGVTATIKQTPGAIGYIEYGYAKLSKAPIALLQNAAGAYVAAGGEGGPIALAGAKFPSGDDLRAWIDDPQEPGAYPIATFTWMLFYKQQDAAKAEALRQMVEYGLTDGQKIADSMGYIPLPEAVIEKVRAASAAVM